MSKCQEADQAIKAYDAYLFAGSFDSDKADLLAFHAADACERAARDRTVNQLTRDYYAGLRDEFRAIYA